MLRSLLISCFLATSLSATDDSPLDRPLKIEIGRPGAVPSAISSTGLQVDDDFYFGEAVNALREELRLHVSDTDIRSCEELFFANLTPRQIILIGLPVYKRQTHAPEAGSGMFRHWAPKHRMPDFQIEEAMKKYAKKAKSGPRDRQRD